MTRHQIRPGERVDLASLPTDGKTLHANREQAEAEFKSLREELSKLQERLYAESKRSLLILFQAMDAGGKDGTTRSLLREVNPQGVIVTSFKAPSQEELSHDYLWRIHQHAPARGMMAVFNRSHYEDVLVVRVDNLVSESVWSKRYEQINQFEKHLSENDVTILKFFLHISHEEQGKRLEERRRDPEKQWKFSEDDLRKRSQWNDYQQAYNDALTCCSTAHAPWHVIPADQNWYRNWAVATVVVDALQRMDPKFPKLDLKERAASDLSP